MSTVRQVRLVVLFLVAAALMAGTPALAGSPISMTLTCVADETDQDHGASGTASLGNVKLHYVWAGPFDYYSYYSAALTVQCEGLTPGAHAPSGTLAQQKTPRTANSARGIGPDTLPTIGAGNHRATAGPVPRIASSSCAPDQSGKGKPSLSTTRCLAWRLQSALVTSPCRLCCGPRWRSARNSRAARAGVAIPAPR